MHGININTSTQLTKLIHSLRDNSGCDIAIFANYFDFNKARLAHVNLVRNRKRRAIGKQMEILAN